MDGLIPLFQRLDRDRVRLRKPSKTLFLCGGRVGEGPIREAHSVRDFLFRNRAVFRKIRGNVVLAEAATQLYRDSRFREAPENCVEEPQEPWIRDDYDRLLDFAPVPRKTKVIRGWTAKKQRGFIAALRESGSVRLSTAEVGMSYEGVYKLRHAPGGEEFARAWDEAVAIGARRVRDVFIDQNIHGIPERVVIGKDVVVERRRFNRRSMIWLLQHHLPEDYPGGSTTHRGGWGARRGQEQWRKATSAEEALERIRQRAKAIRVHRMREYAADPEKRAAYELLHGPEDWSDWGEDGG